MKIQSVTWLCGVALIGSLAAVSSSAAQLPAAGRGDAALAQAAKDNKTVYLLFYRSWDSPAQAAAQAVKAHADKNQAKATWATVRVTDPAEKAVVDKFQTGRAPTPLVLAVHPNGAVTGVFVQKVAEADLARGLVSPKQAECVKLLQQNQLVLLCVQASPQQDVPPGVREFQSDPHFAKRTHVVTAQRDDPNESGFFAQLKIDPRTTAPLTVFMAPPGVMVGTFPGTASKADLAAALHAAGKCCNDPNCKHDHK